MSDINGSIQIADSSKDSQRIDNFLITSLKGVPKSLIYRLLRTGKIRVNGKRVKQTYRLQTDDEISIPQLRITQSQTPVISEPIKAQLESSIIYEDEAILVINKPAGIAVHPGSRVPFGVIEILRALRPAAPYLELAHRLDRETSGCLLIAKNKNMLNELHELLRTQKIKKEYLALVKGEWKFAEKTIDTPLKVKSGSPRDLDKHGGNDKFKTAATTFSPNRIYADFSLMQARIGTGRTHQIRIHACEIGHPIIGDQKYGDYALNRKCKKMGLKRMFLHASAVAFQCPGSGAKYKITAPLDAELKGFLETLTSKN